MAAFYSGTSAYVNMALKVKETATDTNSNASTVNWELIGWFTGTADHWYSNDSHDINIVINNTTVFSRGSATKVKISIGTDHASESNPVIIASGTATIPHNSDGSKIISASFSVVYKWDPNKSWSASGSMALTQIPRASWPSCITRPGTTEDIGKMGSGIYIYTNRASSSFVHVVRYTWGTLSGTIATDVGDSCKWVIPYDFASQIPNQSFGWGTIYCDTYLDGVLIGTQSVGFKASVPSTMQPKCTVETAKVRTSGPEAYVQGIDQLAVTITASGQYGASIASISTKIDGATYTGSTFTTSIINSSGSVEMIVTVTDSRGQKLTLAARVRFQAYTPPQVTASAYRCTESGTYDTKGAYIRIDGNGSLSTLGNQNEKGYIVYWKKTSESAWQSKLITMESYTLTDSTIIPTDVNSGYNVCVRLQDSFLHVDYYTPDVISAFAFIDILMASDTDDTKRGMAIGKIAELEETVDLGWKLVVRKGIHTDDWMECQSLYVNNGVEMYHATPYIDFHFNQSTADYTARLIEMSKGVITALNSISSGSDKRLKKGIKPIDDRYMQLIEALAPKLYRYKKADGQLSAGLIAQDVLQAERQCGLDDSVLVRGTGRYIPDPKDPSKKIVDYFSIDYNCLTVLQLQYFLRRCKSLEDRIINMEKDMAALKKEKEE